MVSSKIEIVKSILALNNKMILIEDISHAQGASIVKNDWNFGKVLMSVRRQQ